MDLSALLDGVKRIVLATSLRVSKKNNQFSPFPGTSFATVLKNVAPKYYSDFVTVKKMFQSLRLESLAQLASGQESKSFSSFQDSSLIKTLVVLFFDKGLERENARTVNRIAKVKNCLRVSNGPDRALHKKCLPSRLA